MFVVGLTGGIGSGKSLVADCFREQGITVVDADQAARQVVLKGSEALAEIARHFGEGILLPDGTLDRGKLRGIVFNNASEKRWLESLLHPLIGEWLADQLNSATSPYAMLESPLLIEANQDQRTHRVLIVDVPESLQLKRAANRDNNDPEQIRAIMDSQLSRTERLRCADDIIDNSGAIEETRRQVLDLHQRYLILAEEQQT